MKTTKCPNCRERAVQVVAEDYPTTLEHDGRAFDLLVPNLPVLVCSKCNYRTLDSVAVSMLGTALRDAAGLLQPETIRKYRLALKLGQKAMADHLGIAPATLSRWETGTQIQQRGYDKLLRQYFANPEVRRSLSITMGISCETAVLKLDFQMPPNNREPIKPQSVTNTNVSALPTVTGGYSTAGMRGAE